MGYYRINGDVFRVIYLFIIIHIRKAQAPWSASYKLEGMCGVKGNTAKPRKVEGA